MNNIRVDDINGRPAALGDIIAISHGWGTNNSYLNICKITAFYKTAHHTKVTLEVLESGLWKYDLGGKLSDKGQIINIQFPMSHCKFIIL